MHLLFLFHFLVFFFVSYSSRLIQSLERFLERVRVDWAGLSEDGESIVAGKLARLQVGSTTVLKCAM